MECNQSRELLADGIQHPEAMNAEEWRAALAHVADCPACQSRMEALRAVVVAETDEDHEAFRAQMTAFVEAQRADEEDNAQFDALRRHLDACVACAELYSLLYETLQAEARGSLPAVSPPSPDQLVDAPQPERGMWRRLAAIGGLYIPKLADTPRPLLDPFNLSVGSATQVHARALRRPSGRVRSLRNLLDDGPLPPVTRLRSGPWPSSPQTRAGVTFAPGEALLYDYSSWVREHSRGVRGRLEDIPHRQWLTEELLRYTRRSAAFDGASALGVLSVAIHNRGDAPVLLPTSRGSITVADETVELAAFADFGGLVDGVLDAQAEDRGVVVFALRQTPWAQLIGVNQSQGVILSGRFPPPHSLDDEPLSGMWFHFAMPLRPA